MKLIDLSGVREACIDSRVIDIQPTTVLIISDGLVAIYRTTISECFLNPTLLPPRFFPNGKGSDNRG